VRDHGRFGIIGNVMNALDLSVIVVYLLGMAGMGIISALEC